MSSDGDMARSLTQRSAAPIQLREQRLGAPLLVGDAVARSAYARDSVGMLAAIQPLIPADITLTLP